MIVTETNSKGYHHGNLRRALIDAGNHILVTSGADAVTLRAVARAAGVSHAAPYSHFADREALLAEIAAPGFRELARRLRDATSGQAGGAAERIRAAGRAYLGFAIERPEEYRLIFGPRVPSFDRHEALSAASREAFGVIVATVAAGQQTGEIAPGPPAGLATFVWASVHGMASLFVDGRVEVGDAAVRERLVESLTGRLLTGILRQQS